MNQSTPSVPPAGQTSVSGESAQLNRAMALANLTRRVKSGGNTFYWIAALSVINSVILAFGGGTYFVVGLATALFVGGVAIGVGQASPDLALIAKVIGLVLSTVIAGIFAIFGYFAGKGQRWAFITGMVLYAVDGLLMLVFADWLGIAFHLYFLWLLFGGLQALTRLEKLAPAHPSDFPQGIGTA
jgi:hypothetical protein